MSNIGILFSDFGPYHVARIEAMAEALKPTGSRVYAYRLYESSIYGWAPVEPANATTVTLGGRWTATFARQYNCQLHWLNQSGKKK